MNSNSINPFSLFFGRTPEERLQVKNERVALALTRNRLERIRLDHDLACIREQHQFLVSIAANQGDQS